MAKKKPVVEAPPAPSPLVTQSAADTIAEALVKAINIAKPMEKKTPFNRKVNTPWMPKDGSAKIKLKRAIFQHGVPVDPDYITNEEIAALNKLKPGLYLDGYVKVLRRKDRGIDISYPIKTASQRLRLVNQHGIRNFRELIERCVTEAENPIKKDQVDADGDLI